MAEIDFDGASKAWRENKKEIISKGLRTGFVYICNHTRSSGRRCRRPVVTQGVRVSRYCKKHEYVHHRVMT